MHRLQSLMTLSLLAPIATATLAAQGSTILANPLPDTARLPSGWTRNLAMQADGTLWCLVHEGGRSNLALFASSDEGTSWTRRANVPTTGDGRGTITADRGCDLVHVAWHASNGGSFANTYYQAFDASTNTFVGTADLLLTGTGSNDQYYPNEIVMTELGTLAVSFNTHRGPTIGSFTPWSGGIFVKRQGDATFQGPFQLNTDTYGMLANMCAIDETLHVAFRTNTGGYGIRYRAFDTTTLQFATNADVPLYGGGQSGMTSTNACDIASDSTDNLYVLYSVGSPNPAGGALEVALAEASTGYSTWTTTVIESDSGLQGGNFSYQHYALGRGDNGVVYALFAKTTDSFQNLYMRILARDPVTGGVLVVPDLTSPAIPILTSTEPDTFQRVEGLIAESVNSALMVAFSGVTASQPFGRVAFERLGTPAATVAWGVSCSGNTSGAPRLASLSLPAAGGNFVQSVNRAPAGAPGLLFAGFDCLRPPFDLTPLGFLGCTVPFTPAGTSNFFVADSTGSALLQLAIPPGLSNVTAHFSALLLDGAANPGGALVANALALHVF